MSKVPRSTIVFALCAVLLATITAVILWRVATMTSTSPRVSGILEEVGLPGLKGALSSRKFSARSALLWDSEAKIIRFEQNGFERVPIASLTKLMTAMIAVDHGLEWDRLTTIESYEYVAGGRLLLHPGEEASLRDLFHASLIGSANNATLAYVRALGIDHDEFVLRMNRKAVELGLEQTHFADVTGLDKENISTAYEIARLAEHAWQHYPDIAAATSAREYSFTLAGSGRVHTIKNTNRLISESDETFTGSKTGYIYEARYCLVVQGAGEQATRIAVILGSPSEAEHFADIKRLLTLAP